MGSLRVLILPFNSLCYACTKVKETEMAVPCTASVNDDGDSRRKKKAFKLPSKTYQSHLLVQGLSKTMSLWKGIWQFSCKQKSFVLLLSCHVLMIPFQSDISHSESF